MPSSGYFDTPFGIDGTLVAVPDAIQGDGSVSYAQGWGVDYTLPNTNPSYKYMPQGQFNQLFFDITSAIQDWQQNTIAPFITSSMNGGSPFSYSKYNMVLHSGIGYISLANSNTDTPPSANWAAINLGSNNFYSGGVSTGSANAQIVATLSPAGFSLSNDGATVCCTAGFTNTGPTDFALGGTASTATKKWNGSSYVALSGGEITLNESIFLSVNVTEACLVLTDAPTLGAIASLNLDGVNFASSGGNLAFGSAPVLPNGTTVTTQSPGDDSAKACSTAYADAAAKAALLVSPLGVGSDILATHASGTVAIGNTVAGSSLTPVILIFNGASSGVSATGDTLPGGSMWMAMMTYAIAAAGNVISWKRIS